MECDELIEQMLKYEPDQHVDKHRERLAALAAGGKCSEYFGENYNMTDEEIKKLYARYESRLGATMTKTID